MTREGEERRIGLVELSIVALVLLTAAGLRHWTLGAHEATNPLFGAPLLDEELYLEQAARIRAGEGERWGWYLSPAWPALLAALGVETRAAGARLALWLGSTTAALTALGALLLAPDRSRLSRALGLAAGLFVAAAPTIVFHDIVPGTEALIACSSTAALVALATPRVPGWVGGVLSGVALIARASAAGLLVLLVPAGSRRRVATAVLGLALPLAIALGANLSLHDVPSPLPWGGSVNLLLGNSPQSRELIGYTAEGIRNEPRGQQEDVIRLAGVDPEPHSAGATASRWARGEATRTMLAEPGPTLGHLLHKLALLLHYEGIGGNHDFGAERSFAPWTRTVPAYGFLALGLAAGAWWLLRRDAGPGRWIAVALVVQAALVVAVFPLERYRLALLPQAALLTAVGAGTAMRASVRDRGIAAALAAVVVGIGLLPVRLPVRPERWVNLAGATVAASPTAAKDPQVRKWLLRAIEEDPTFVRAHLYLGHLTLAADPVTALGHFEDAVATGQGGFEAQIGLSRALFNLGRRDEALRRAIALAEANPTVTDLWAEAAHVAALAGLRRRALPLLQRARALDPEHRHVRKVELLLGR